jgi:hypothetical protein
LRSEKGIVMGLNQLVFKKKSRTGLQKERAWKKEVPFKEPVPSQNRPAQQRAHIHTQQPNKAPTTGKHVQRTEITILWTINYLNSLKLKNNNAFTYDMLR